jgi:prophage regulatory protein
MTYPQHQHFSNSSKSEVVLKKSAVITTVGLSSPTIWRKVKDKSFPQPIHLGGRSIGWLQSEVHEWINERAALRAHVTTPTGAKA